MEKFNQAEFESKAKKMVAKYCEIDEKDVSMVWFSKVGSNAKTMLNVSVDPNYYYFDVVYNSEINRYIMSVYNFVHCDFYDEKPKDTSTPHPQTEDDKVKDPAETKCPICQEHNNILGLTDAFDLRIKEDILTLTDKTVHSDTQFPKDVFKINYCPFCGRKLSSLDQN